MHRLETLRQVTGCIAVFKLDIIFYIVVYRVWIHYLDFTNDCTTVNSLCVYPLSYYEKGTTS